MMERRKYPSDLTESQWQMIHRLLRPNDERSKDEVIKRVAEDFRMPASALYEVTIWVFGEPVAAGGEIVGRMAYRVPIKFSNYQEPSGTYMDAQTLKLLDINHVLSDCPFGGAKRGGAICRSIDMMLRAHASHGPARRLRYQPPSFPAALLEFMKRFPSSFVGSFD